MFKAMNEPFKDLKKYPEAFIKIDSDCVHIPVTYMQTWNDGFGARGWKLDVTIGDPQIIASTRETGLKINTSVFVHDILDHFLSGFNVSGHRSEAMALRQLSIRTDSDPGPDYTQMIKEDILNGVINGESLMSFMPSEIKKILPENINNNEVIYFLKKHLTQEQLIKTFFEHFFILGKEGDAHAKNSWKLLGLNPDKKTEIGEAIQKSLNYIDSKIEHYKIDKIKATVSINNNHVTFLTEYNEVSGILVKVSDVLDK